MRLRCCSQWLIQPTVVEEAPARAAAVDETSMFEDEDIGIHVSASASSSSQPPAAAATASSRSVEHIDLTVPKRQSRDDIRWALFPSAARAAAAAASSSSSAAAAFTVPGLPKRSRLSLTGSPPPRSEVGSTAEAQQSPVPSPPRSAPLPRGKRGRAARHAIPRSPHCRVLPSSINRRFVCVYRRGSGERNGHGGQEEEGDEIENEEGEGEERERGGQQEERGGGEAGEGEECGLDFVTRQACENHIRTRHTREKLRCAAAGCLYASYDLQNLTKHERKAHMTRT